METQSQQDRRPLLIFNHNTQATGSSTFEVLREVKGGSNTCALKIGDAHNGKNIVVSPGEILQEKERSLSNYIKEALIEEVLEHLDVGKFLSLKMEQNNKITIYGIFTGDDRERFSDNIDDIRFYPTLEKARNAFLKVFSVSPQQLLLRIRDLLQVRQDALVRHVRLQQELQGAGIELPRRDHVRPTCFSNR